jgi:hypothetical protein
VAHAPSPLRPRPPTWLLARRRRLAGVRASDDLVLEVLNLVVDVVSRVPNDADRSHTGQGRRCCSGGRCLGSCKSRFRRLPPPDANRPLGSLHLYGFCPGQLQSVPAGVRKAYSSGCRNAPSSRCGRGNHRSLMQVRYTQPRDLSATRLTERWASRTLDGDGYDLRARVQRLDLRNFSSRVPSRGTIAPEPSTLPPVRHFPEHFLGSFASVDPTPLMHGLRPNGSSQWRRRAPRRTPSLPEQLHRRSTYLPHLRAARRGG